MVQPPAAAETPKGAAHLAFCVLGIYASFLIWGWLQERLTKTPYKIIGADGKETSEEEKFKFITFLNLVQYSFAGVSAALLITVGLVDTNKKLGSDLHGAMIPIAITNSLGSQLGYASLNYISFPLHILTKSCKLVPVMAMGFLVNGKRYTAGEIFSVLAITVGLCVFAMKAGGDDKATQLLGIALVFANLSLDGWTNATQDKINKRHQPSPHDMMVALNLWSVLLLLPCAFYVLPESLVGAEGLVTLDALGLEEEHRLGAGWLAADFFRRHPDALADMLAFCVAGAIGQNFIFTSLKWFGSMTNVTITITRKFMTILFSAIYFQHDISVRQWFGCALVFAGLGLNIKLSVDRRNAAMQQPAVADADTKKDK
jgi:UDP-galactose transporter B1